MFPRPRTYLVLARRLSHSTHKPAPLVEQHADFLNLVKLHGGGGDIHVAKYDSYAGVIIDNQTKRNSITGKMMFKLAHIVDDLVNDQNCGQGPMVAVVITGAGTEAFCSGADLTLAKEVLDTPAKGGLMSAFMTDALTRLRQSGLISLCSLNGPALGGGAEIATTCDFRIMPQDTSTYVQFVHAKIGACPGWGGARRLTHIVGRNHAIMACAGSVKIFGPEALSMGLVDKIYLPFDSSSAADDDVVTPASHAIAEGLTFLQPFVTQKFPGSVRAIKLAIAGVEHLDGTSSIELEAQLFRQRWAGSDNKAAFSAPKK
jgi:ethylmalonyl-CoA/methylmalonyl-CoA decarboxylase